MNYKISVFTLTIGHLNRVMVRREPMDFDAPADTVGNFELVDLENGNRRRASKVSFREPNAYAGFENLMAFGLFQCALESHGFRKDFDYG